MWWLTIPVIIYSASLVIYWLSLRQTRDTAPLPPASRKFISVVIACRNEEKTIGALLEDLRAQSYPPGDFEIIVVDDNSTDGTVAIVNDFTIKAPPGTLKIYLLHNQEPGKKSAMRHGIKHALGEYVITTDADCHPGPQWLACYSSFLETAGADVVLGPVYEKPGMSFASIFSSYEFAALQSVTEATARAGHPVMCNGANMGFRRDIYLQHSGVLRHDIASGDDMFLMHAVKDSGGIIKWLGCDGAAVGTAAAVPAAAVLRQRARWASKAFYYRDAATLATAAATAACNAAVTAAAVASLFNIRYLTLTIVLYAIRLIPDYLMVSHPLKKRKEAVSFPAFILMEIVYPFYFLVVAIISLLPSMRQFRGR